MRTSYYDCPILMVPEWIPQHCATELSSSPGAIPLDCMAAWSMLMLISRCLPPNGKGRTGAGHGHQVGAPVRRVVIELRFGQAISGNSELQNGYARRRKIDDLRRQDTRRKLTQQVLRCGGHLAFDGSSEASGGSDTRHPDSLHAVRMFQRLYESLNKRSECPSVNWLFSRETK